MKRAILLLALCALIMPQPVWSMTAKQFDDMTIHLMGRPKDADKLLKICATALAEVKDDPEFESFIHVMKSHAHLMKKEYKNAEKDARIVIDSGRQEDLGHSALRDVFFARGQFEEGLAICLQGTSRVRGERHQEAASQNCHDVYLEATSVKPETLWNAYKKNPAQAAKNYQGRSITVLGVVASVESLDNGGARVTFSLDDDSKNVICMFDGQTPEAPATSADKPADDTAAADKLTDSKPTDSKPTDSKTSGKDGKPSEAPAVSFADKLTSGKGKPAEDIAYSLNVGKTVAKDGKSSVAPASSADKPADGKTPDKDGKPSNVPANSPADKPADGKDKPADGKSPVAPASSADKPADDKTPDKDGKPSKAPADSPADKPVDAKDKPAPELPEVGEIVVIAGKVRGMEANNVILVNCEKIR